jgi:hypothetical protein
MKIDIPITKFTASSWVIEVIISAGLGTDVALNIETSIPCACHLVAALFLHKRCIALIALPNESCGHSLLNLTSY